MCKRVFLHVLVCVFECCGAGDSGNVDVWLFSWSGLGCLGGGVREGGWVR